MTPIELLSPQERVARGVGGFWDTLLHSPAAVKLGWPQNEQDRERLMPPPTGEPEGPVPRSTPLPESQPQYGGGAIPRPAGMPAGPVPPPPLRGPEFSEGPAGRARTVPAPAGVGEVVSPPAMPYRPDAWDLPQRPGTEGMYYGGDTAQNPSPNEYMAPGNYADRPRAIPAPAGIGQTVEPPGWVARGGTVRMAGERGPANVAPNERAFPGRIPQPDTGIGIPFRGGFTGGQTAAGVSNAQAARIQTPTQGNPIPETETAPVRDINKTEQSSAGFLGGATPATAGPRRPLPPPPPPPPERVAYDGF
jgi:hypothetical protein